MSAISSFFDSKTREEWQTEHNARVRETYSAVERFLYHDALAVARSLCNTSIPSYRIYNLCSERCYPPSRFAGSFERFPADDHHPAPFNTLLAFCVSAACFLAGGDGTVLPLFRLEESLPTGMPSSSSSPSPHPPPSGGLNGKVGGALSSLLSVGTNRRHGNLQFMPVDPSLVDASALNRVVAIHCKAGKGRTGAMCVALMLYLGQFERGANAASNTNNNIKNTDTTMTTEERAASVTSGADTTVGGDDSSGAQHGVNSNNRNRSKNKSSDATKLGRSSPLFDRRIHPLFRALNWYGITRTHNNKGVSIASQLQFLEYLNWYLESERHRLARLFANSQHPDDVTLVKQHPKLACPVNFPLHYVPQLLRPPPCPTALLKSISFSPYPCVDLDGKCKPYFIILCRGPNHTHYPLGQQEHVSVESDTLRPIYDSRLGWLSQRPHLRAEVTSFSADGAQNPQKIIMKNEEKVGSSSSSALPSPLSPSHHRASPSVRVVEKSTVSAISRDTTLASHSNNRNSGAAGWGDSPSRHLQPPLPPGVDPETTFYFPMRGFEITGEVRFVFYAEQRTNSILFGTGATTTTPSPLSAAAHDSPSTVPSSPSPSPPLQTARKKKSATKDQYLFSFWIHTGFMQQQSRATRIEAYTPEGKFTHTTTDNKKSTKDDAAAATSRRRDQKESSPSAADDGNGMESERLSRFSRFAHLADSVDCLDLHATARSGSGGVVRLRKEQLDGASKKNAKLFDSAFVCNIEFSLL